MNKSRGGDGFYYYSTQSHVARGEGGGEEEDGIHTQHLSYTATNPVVNSWYPTARSALKEVLWQATSKPDHVHHIDTLAKTVADTVAKRGRGWTLPQEFYIHPKMHQVDLQKVWFTSWLFAGYTCQIPNKGDYITFELDEGKESVVIVRGKDGKISASLNVCRHRGSRLVTQPQGNLGSSCLLVCPYHQWVYSADGRLVAAKDMPDDFNKATNGLHTVAVQEVGGLIFIHFKKNKSGDPLAAFDECRSVIEPELLPHGLVDAQIAFTETYDINANWKVVYENNRDCYHCLKGHPEYIQSNYDLHFIYQQEETNNSSNNSSGSDKSSAEHDAKFNRITDPKSSKYNEINDVLESKSKYWQSLGLQTTASPASHFPGSGWFRASRVPLRPPFLVESLDGAPVAKKVMGSLKSFDMGSMRIHTFPNFWMHASSDHAVATKLVPMGAERTRAEVTWLVAKGQVEGEDYCKEKMTPFWAKTSEQDWRLCEMNQSGLRSRWHEIGRLSDKKEMGVEKFLGWYLKKLKSEGV